MDFDYSKINLEYLILARDLVRANPRGGALLLGVPEDSAQLVSGVTARELALLSQIKPPLVVLRHEAWWWQRLLSALQEGDPEELQLILQHAGMLSES